ncbi:MAG TPA: UPF0149 family protein [Aridibacter sp.]|nr:UPF0149 family protein [Aridibacter sp.]
MTPELNRLPSDEELDLLEETLSNRVDLSDPNFKGNAGIASVSQLDGFLAAIVSGPNMVAPSVWMDEVWGDYPVSWDSEHEAMLCFGTMFRMMNSTAFALMNDPEDYEPLFAEFEDGPGEDFVDFWCSGYMRGVALWGDLEGIDEKLEALLLPILVHSAYCPEEISEKVAEEERMQMKRSLPDCARLIHEYWLDRRDGSGSGSPSRKTHTAGVNEPCPCGSGQKYKKCCAGRDSVN